MLLCNQISVRNQQCTLVPEPCVGQSSLAPYLEADMHGDDDHFHTYCLLIDMSLPIGNVVSPENWPQRLIFMRVSLAHAKLFKHCESKIGNCCAVATVPWLGQDAEIIMTRFNGRQIVEYFHAIWRSWYVRSSTYHTNIRSFSACRRLRHLLFKALWKHCEENYLFAYNQNLHASSQATVISFLAFYSMNCHDTFEQISILGCCCPTYDK